MANDTPSDDLGDLDAIVPGPMPPASGAAATPAAPLSGPDQWWNSLNPNDKAALHQQTLTQALAHRAVLGQALQKVMQGQMLARQTGQNIDPMTLTRNQLGQPPHPGAIQWMGGMPLGYNDNVAKANALMALATNLSDMQKQRRAQQLQQQGYGQMDPEQLQQLLGMMTLFGGGMK